MPIIDLHNHTTFSYDGKNTPEAIIQNAIAHNVDVIGITDHQFTIRQDLEYYISYLKYCQKKIQRTNTGPFRAWNRDPTCPVRPIGVIMCSIGLCTFWMSWRFAGPCNGSFWISWMEPYVSMLQGSCAYWYIRSRRKIRSWYDKNHAQI